MHIVRRIQIDLLNKDLPFRFANTNIIRTSKFKKKCVLCGNIINTEIRTYVENKILSHRLGYISNNCF